VITQNGLNKITDALRNIITTATYTIGSTTTEIPISELTLNQNNITVKLYLDDNISGTITKFQLKAPDGMVVIERTDYIVKPLTKGLLVVFNINISETNYMKSR